MPAQNKPIERCQMHECEGAAVTNRRCVKRQGHKGKCMHVSTVPIPVSVAKNIAEGFYKSQVVILAFEPETGRFHTATYGVSANDKLAAGALGVECIKLAGCDVTKFESYEDFRNEHDSALYRMGIELMQKMLARRDGSPWAMGQMENLLKQAGKHPRHG